VDVVCHTGVMWDRYSVKVQLRAAYINMLQESTVPTGGQLYGDDDMWYQQDGSLPHYHRDVRAYLDNTFPDRWIGPRGSVEYPPR
jgi:hypothetical protein